MDYDTLLSLSDRMGLTVVQQEFAGSIEGLYVDGCIFINEKLDEEKACVVLAEEIGHHFTADRNCLDQNQCENILCELKGRAWSYEVMLPISQLRFAFHAGIKSVDELAELFHLPRDFIRAALQYYFYSKQIKRAV